MGATDLLFLVVLGVVFVVWAFLMFRMLWRLTRRSLGRLEETGGGYFRWVGHSLATFGEFFTSREDRAERRRILLLTLVLFAIILARIYLLGSV